MFDWSGVYVGGHIGGGWTKDTFADLGASEILSVCCNSNFLSPGAAATYATHSSFLGGLQAGWMSQNGNWARDRNNGDEAFSTPR
jgi:hypothetical protein